MRRYCSAAIVAVVAILVSIAVLAILASIAVVAPASAQTYPDKPIKFIVPFAAGSATDTLARVLGEQIGKAQGWQVVIENTAGANGTIAGRAVARAAPDGYTVLIGTNTTHAAAHSLMKSVPYDQVADFEHLTRLGSITLALVVHPSVPAKTVAELVAYSKANPGTLTFGSGSSSSRLAGEMLKAMTGLDVRHVAYRSNPLAMQDLLGGHISMMFADVATTLPQVKDGKVTGIGVSSAKSTALAPDLPTMQESGVQGYELTAWFAAWGPAGVPAPVLEKLRSALVAAANDKATQEKLLAVGIEPETSTSAELKAHVTSETRKWAEIVKAAGIQAE
jgi:tripartite-type tricarboxylate transporter receptor subunit TctC